MDISTFLTLHPLLDLAIPKTDDRVWKEGRATARDKSCASVLYSAWIYYSWGKHYPLKWKFKGVVFVNNRRYSRSTAKHSSSAYQLGAINVKLQGQVISENSIIDSLQAEYDEALTELSKKTRTNTAIYRSLKRKLDEARARLQDVKNKFAAFIPNQSTDEA